MHVACWLVPKLEILQIRPKRAVYVGGLLRVLSLGGLGRENVDLKPRTLTGVTG